MKNFGVRKRSLSTRESGADSVGEKEPVAGKIKDRGIGNNKGVQRRVVYL